MGLSDDAKMVCARWFGMSPRDTLRSHPPHATLSKVRPAVDELIAAGLITEEPFNHLGSILLTGSEQARQIGREKMAETLDTPSSGVRS